MTNKNKYIKIISSTLIAGTFLFIAIGSGESKSSSSSSNLQNLHVDDWNSQQSVIQGIQGKWYWSGSYKDFDGDSESNKEMIVTISGNTIQWKNNIEGRGYEDASRKKGETFTLESQEEFVPCSSMKETDHTKRYRFSLEQGGEIEVTNANGNCEEEFIFNDRKLSRYNVQ